MHVYVLNVLIFLHAFMLVYIWKKTHKSVCTSSFTCHGFRPLTLAEIENMCHLTIKHSPS